MVTDNYHINLMFLLILSKSETRKDCYYSNNVISNEFNYSSIKNQVPV